MKRILITLVLIVCIKTSEAQNNPDSKIDTIDVVDPTIPVDPAKLKDQVFTAVESEPVFPGGIQEFYNYIGQNIHIPPEFFLKGKVFVSYAVDVDGQIDEIQIIKGIVTERMKKEIIRVLAASPKWKPAIQNSKPIKVKYTMPFNF